jgi:hypothetical protein
VSTPETGRTGHLYAVEFSSGIVKVGQSTDINRRLQAHLATAAIHNVTADCIWVSEPVDHLDARERELLGFCAERWPLAGGAEYFRQADLGMIIAQANRAGAATREVRGRSLLPMPAGTGTSWMLAFGGHPSEAAAVRAWVRKRVSHADAQAVAHELFIAVLESGANVIEMTLSTADTRLKITARGPLPLELRHSHGPGWRIISGLSRTSGVTVDERGLWAEIRDGVNA